MIDVKTIVLLTVSCTLVSCTHIVYYKITNESGTGLASKCVPGHTSVSVSLCVKVKVECNMSKRFSIMM